MSTHGMGLLGPVLFVFQAIVLPLAQSAGAQSASQSVVIVEAGGLNVRQRSREDVLSAALTLSARRATSSYALSGSAMLVQSNDSAGAIQGTVGAEWALPWWRAARVEASASSTQFGALSSVHGTSKSGFIRPQIVRDRHGVFATIGAGSLERDRIRFHSLDWDVGTWLSRGWLSGALTLKHAYTNDYPIVEDLGFVLTDSTARHYAMRDVETTINARWKRLDLQVNGTFRNGIESTRGHTAAMTLAALVQLSSRFGISMVAGEQLADFRTGVPSARLVGASLRFNLFRSATPLPATPAVTRRKVPVSAFAAEVTTRAEGGATVRVRVDAPADARVEVSGSFNEWSAVSMSRGVNAFEHVLELPSGTHRIAVRINGGPWRAPAGLTRVRDDLGGEAGLVVVP